MAVMKVETDIASIKENLIGGGVILVIVYVKTFKTGFIESLDIHYH